MKAGVWSARIWIFLLLGGAAVVEFFFPASAYEPRVDRILLSPAWGHWLGTDSLGRDVLARILAGVKISLAVGILGSLIAFALGVGWGALGAWFGGWLDRVLMRITDLLLSVPSFALVAVLILFLQASLPLAEGEWKNFWGLVLGIGLTRWMSVARVSRGLVLSTKALPYVEASKVIGNDGAGVLWKHIRPNIAASLWILLGLQIPSNILYESFMSFVGLGVQAPQTSWGLLVQEGWRSLSSYPQLILGPSFAVFLTVWSLHVLMEDGRASSRRTRFPELPPSRS